jgi:hypothetical protein
VPQRPDLTAGNLLPAALGGVAAALLVSSFGIAGSLVGAALAPVAYLIIKEITRGPTERVVAKGRSQRRGPHAWEPTDDETRSTSASPSRRVYRRRRWPYVAAPAALAFVIAVGVVTVPELIGGSSLTGERRTTFFGEGPVGSLSAPAPSGEESPPKSQGTETDDASTTGRGDAETPDGEQTEALPEEGTPGAGEQPAAPAATEPQSEAPVPEAEPSSPPAATEPQSEAPVPEAEPSSPPAATELPPAQ